tara:strand:- start:696 stop:1268 length:573 start_codon:yes stop_codon:yes gene_type:complete
MLKKLVKLANTLDKKGLKKEADQADLCIKIAKQSMGEWAVKNMSSEHIADLAEKMPPEKIKSIIVRMDPAKKHAIISDLAKDPQIQAVVLRSIDTGTIKAAVTNMDPAQKREVVGDLAKDPEVQSMMLESLGLPPGLADLAGDMLARLPAALSQGPSEAAASPIAGPQPAGISSEELQSLFADRVPGGTS